ncbi:MAG: hypothetical protein R3C68_14770 [Myxococcota bacterium]
MSLLACTSPPKTNTARSSTHVDAATAAPPDSALNQAQEVRRRLKLPAAEDAYYGIYLNGIKVGWMLSRFEAGPKIKISTQLEAAVGGLGQVSSIKLNESRSYDADSGGLLSLAFEQTASTGAVSVHGESKGDGIHLKVSAGGHVSENVVPSKDNLESALATLRMAQTPQLGETRRVEHFDASLMKSIVVEHRVKSIESRLFAGVQTKAVEIETVYPDLGIHESSWLDIYGKVLESKIGGFL